MKRRDMIRMLSGWKNVVVRSDTKSWKMGHKKRKDWRKEVINFKMIKKWGVTRL